MNDNQKIFNVLKEVIDPEIGLNIVDLGLVYGIKETEKEITVMITLTTPGCPMHDSITKWAENAVKKIAGDKNVVINLVWQPQWTPALMTDEAKQQLGM